MPITGLMPAAFAASYIASAPYMLPWSVIPIAGWPSAAAAATTSPMRDAPSSIEYSVWTCRWTNDRAITPALKSDGRAGDPALGGTLRWRIGCHEASRSAPLLLSPVDNLPVVHPVVDEPVE